MKENVDTNFYRSTSTSGDAGWTDAAQHSLPLARPLNEEHDQHRKEGEHLGGVTVNFFFFSDFFFFILL